MRPLDLPAQVERLQVAAHRALGDPQRLDQLVKRGEPLTRDQVQQVAAASLGKHFNLFDGIRAQFIINIRQPAKTVKKLHEKETDFARIFFFNDTATTEIYTLSLHDALPI